MVGGQTIALVQNVSSGGFLDVFSYSPSIGQSSREPSSSDGGYLSE